MKGYEKATTCGLYDEIAVCRSYGHSVMSPPEEASPLGYSRIADRENAVRAELARRADGVLVGRKTDEEEWEEIPPWGSVVACVSFPTLDGWELVAYRDESLAAEAAAAFNASATEDFLWRFGGATVEKRLGW